MGQIAAMPFSINLKPKRRLFGAPAARETPVRTPGPPVVFHGMISVNLLWKRSFRVRFSQRNLVHGLTVRDILLLVLVAAAVLLEIFGR